MSPVRRLLAAAALIALVPVAALAYAEFMTSGGLAVPGHMAMWLNGSSQAVPVSASNPLPVTASVSASIAGFTPGLSYGTLTATGSSSASTALPTGTTVNVSNTSTTTPVSCVMATGAATATTNKDIIQPGSVVQFTIGSYDHIACIDQTGSASSVVVLSGGSGLFAGSGGGGTGGGGGAATVADGADVTQGAIADAAYTTGNGTVISILKGIYTKVAAALAVTQSGTWTVQPGNSANTTAWKVDGSAVIQPVSGSVSPTPATSGGLSVFSAIVPNNTTSFVIKASAGQLYGLEGFSVAATIPVWLKTYDAAQGSVTCGSGTPKARYLIPASGGAPGSGLIPSSALGDAYGTAITGCITAGIADNDTTAPAASSYTLNAHYK